MKSGLALLFAASVSLAGAARAGEHPVEATAWGSFVDVTGKTDADAGISVDFRTGGGAGLSANFYLARMVSVEVGAAFWRARGDLRFQGTSVTDLGYLDMIPIEGLVQLHFSQDGPLDPYLGVGGAYVIFQNLHSRDLNTADIGVITVKNRLAFLANAGIGFRLGGSVALVLDGKYLPLKPTSEGPGSSLDLKLDPLVVSGGVRLRF